MKLKPFKLERFFARYEFSAPYLLSSSDCEAMTIGDLLALEPDATQKFHAHWLGYTESTGNPALRTAIAGLYQHIEPGQILVHNGAEEAIFNFMNAVLDHGDHVLVHYPCYQSLLEVVSGIGCEVTLWETHEADGWELDLDFLERNLQPNTRAIIFNCPHNPTGYLMSQAKLEAIFQLARERNILIFSDEVYRGLERNPADTLPAACDLYENAVSLGVMSKSLGLPGLRIGWIATRNHEIYTAMENFKDYLTICNGAPSEFLATLALRHRETIIGRNLQIIKDNLALLNPFFDYYSELFNWTPPKAGSTAFPSLKLEQDMDIEEFCINLVEHQGILLLPGTMYGWGNQNFRLGFGRKSLPDALAKLDRYLKERWAKE